MLGRLPAVKNRWGNGGVQMMSIHKSKGLEFPIVFLCDLEHAFSRQDFDTPVLVHPALGLGPLCIDLKRKIRYPTMARLALEEKLRRENLAEEQRILYVAMTRPKEKLILVDALYGAEKRLQKRRRRGLSRDAGGCGEGEVLRRLDYCRCCAARRPRLCGIWPG